jgi:hypothetical protein
MGLLRPVAGKLYLFTVADMQTKLHKIPILFFKKKAICEYKQTNKHNSTIMNKSRDQKADW